MFATSEGSGTLSLWNLNQETEVYLLFFFFFFFFFLINLKFIKLFIY